MIITILKPGVCATIQDPGRKAWQAWGVPAGGAADRLSHSLANFLTGNPATAPTLEIAGGDWSARVDQGGWMGFTGPEASLQINGLTAPSGHTIYVPDGALLRVLPGTHNMYSYLSVREGWLVPRVLGSASTCLPGGFGGWNGRPLIAGDRLEGQSKISVPSRKDAWISPWHVMPEILYPPGPHNVVRVIPGPEWHWWTAGGQEAFMHADWMVSTERDRMGMRVKGIPLPCKEKKTMISSAVVPGTVQVPSDGYPVILLADAQTTGGYPRIAQVIAADLPKLTQRPVHSVLHFQQTDLDTAEQLLFKQEQQLAKLEIALKNKLN